MRRLGFALGVAVLVVTAGSLPEAANGRFDQKLSKDKQVLHVLNRLTFGPRPGDVDRVRGLGVDKWIRQQLQPQLIAENPLVEARLRPLASIELATWQIFETYVPPPQPALANPTVIVRPRPLAQLVSPEQLEKLSTGTPEERLATIGAISPESLGPVLAALTPKMLEGLPDLQKQAEKARQTEMSRQLVLRSANGQVSLNTLLTPEERRVTQQGTVDERRALLMSFDAAKRKQVLRMLPPTAVAGIPELQREALAARQPPMFVNQELIDSRMYRALYSNRQLEEVLVDFWLNHFNVFNGKGPARMLLTSYERDAIRPHVLGQFRDLLLATARHPAMLYYLDNWQSQAPREDIPMPPANPRRPGLNENYGRELMELHTLGVDGGYTQDDVIAVARAFTGWTIYDPNRIAEFQFNPAFHDRKEKRVLGHTIPAGGGEQDGIQVIDILARHPSTARFISRKLAQRFVADDPPPSLVDRMAKTFTATGGDLRSVMETMLTSREFMSEGAWQAKLKSPLEMVLSSVRALGADVTDTTALAQRIAELGQPLYGKAEPTGYSTTADAWESSAGFLGRINFAGALAAGKIEGVKVDEAGLPNTGEAAARRLLGAAVSPATRSRLENGASQPLSPASLAAVVIASPDLQRRSRC
jgi:uncharacterized protein (DUF1800 family)